MLDCKRRTISNGLACHNPQSLYCLPSLIGHHRPTTNLLIQRRGRPEVYTEFHTEFRILQCVNLTAVFQCVLQNADSDTLGGLLQLSM